MSSQSSSSLGEVSRKPVATKEPEVVSQHIVEFVSDSGEGAQTAGQMFGTVSARMGNGVWTVEIIPAEIEPPHRSRAGASGNRIRIASYPVTNVGEAADIVVAFNEQVPYSRIDVGALREGTIIFLENVWADSPEEEVRTAYREAVNDYRERGFVVVVFQELEKKLGRKGEKVVQVNRELVQAGYDWGTDYVPYRYEVPPGPKTEKMVVMNGNQAAAMGIMAAGIEVVAMYPITPALRRPRSHTTWPRASTRSVASCTRPRTRSRPSGSRSAPVTPARRQRR